MRWELTAEQADFRSVLAGWSGGKCMSRYLREARLLEIAPLSQEMVLDYLGSHVLGLPRSY